MFAMSKVTWGVGERLDKNTAATGRIAALEIVRSYSACRATVTDTVPEGPFFVRLGIGNNREFSELLATQVFQIQAMYAFLHGAMMAYKVCLCKGNV